MGHLPRTTSYLHCTLCTHLAPSHTHTFPLSSYFTCPAYSLFLPLSHLLLLPHLPTYLLLLLFALLTYNGWSSPTTWEVLCTLHLPHAFSYCLPPAPPFATFFSYLLSALSCMAPLSPHTPPPFLKFLPILDLDHPISQMSTPPHTPATHTALPSPVTMFVCKPQTCPLPTFSHHYCPFLPHLYLPLTASHLTWWYGLMWMEMGRGRRGRTASDLTWFGWLMWWKEPGGKGDRQGSLGFGPSPHGRRQARQAAGGRQAAGKQDPFHRASRHTCLPHIPPS